MQQNGTEQKRLAEKKKRGDKNPEVRQKRAKEEQGDVTNQMRRDMIKARKRDTREQNSCSTDCVHQHMNTVLSSHHDANCTHR